MAISREKRVALVIGNAVYKHADALRNPANDAKAIGAALTRLGFSGANPRLNLDQNGLLIALKDFARDADGADMAVIYFAGHGVEVDGRNSLIPVDAKLERSTDVEYETVSLDQALNSVNGTQRLRLIILDACRNNPFRARMWRSGGTRSIGRGLRSIEPSGNVLVAYAAKHGTFALDGKGDNSPFAEALRDHIEKPGLEIGQLFREVRDDVLERTGKEQEPHIYGTLGKGMIYLKPLVDQTITSPIAADRSPLNGLKIEPRSRPLLTAAITGLGASLVALAVAYLMPSGKEPVCTQQKWQEAERKSSLNALQQMASDCHGDTFGILAREELEKLDKSAWDLARDTGSDAGFRTYVAHWKDQPDYQGKFVSEAEAALARLASGKPFEEKSEEREADRLARADDTAFDEAKRAGTRAALTDYQSRYPKGRNVEAARSELTRLGFVEVAVGTANEARWIEAGGGKKDGESFKDCADCPEMVAVPAGDFMMGSTLAEIEAVTKEAGDDWYKNEAPRHKVALVKPFAVGKSEVTFAEWDACVNSGICKIKPGDQGWGRGDWPVINISWDEVNNEYLPWLSKRTGKEYHLLSEAEWEYVARAGTTGPFFFDGKITTDKANYDGRPKGEYRKKTLPVRTFEPNPWGLYQVHGNVWEWAQDCYADSYMDVPADGSPKKETTACARVLRGGSWGNFPFRLRSAVRVSYAPGNRGYSIGFRVARTLLPL